LTTTPKNLSLVFKKFGFKNGKTFNFFGKKTKINSVSDDIIDMEFIDGVYQVAGKATKTIRMGTWDFLKKYILIPSGKLNQTFVPTATKILVRCINSDGTVNQNINKVPEIDINQISKELEALTQYEGDSGKYTIQNTVKTFQRGLILLGKTMKGNDDGKFGPSTKSALEAFQNENGLQGSLGKMDRVTAKKLADILNTNKPKGNFNYQEIANSLLSYVNTK
jgi:hypothetical protein